MADGALTSRGDPVEMDIDSDSVRKIEKLETFSKEAARAFFREYGLIHHQIKSYNDFVEGGIQDLFASLGDINVDPGYDPSKKGELEWKHATISYGKIRLEKPKFWINKGDEVEMVNMTPRNARLQQMTYSAQLYADVRIQVYTREGSEKAKTGSSSSGKETYMWRKVSHDETKEIMIGTRLPVMVGSVCCWLNTCDNGDCLFESGGYFLIKGMEKTFQAQEQRCSTRIWLTDTPSWKCQYVTEFKRGCIYCNLDEAGKGERFNSGRYITVSFLYATIPIWIMFFALGMASDKEVFDVIGIEHLEASLVNIILATIKESEEQCQNFRKAENAKEYVDRLVKTSKFPPEESFDECVAKYLFKGIKGKREKALFLGYMCYDFIREQSTHKHKKEEEILRK